VPTTYSQQPVFTHSLSGPNSLLPVWIVLQNQRLDHTGLNTASFALLVRSCQWHFLCTEGNKKKTEGFYFMYNCSNQFKHWSDWGSSL